MRRYIDIDDAVKVVKQLFDVDDNAFLIIRERLYKQGIDIGYELIPKDFKVGDIVKDLDADEYGVIIRECKYKGGEYDILYHNGYVVKNVKQKTITNTGKHSRVVKEFLDYIDCVVLERIKEDE